MRSRFLAYGCVVLIALAATTAQAGEGRVQIFEPLVLDGNLRDINGRYVVTRDIASPTDIIIDIIGTGTETVDIDLNGFTLSSASTVAVIRASGLKNMILRNGTARLMTPTGNVVQVTGISPADNEDNLIVEDLRVRGGDIGILSEVVTNLRLERNFVQDTGDAIVIQNTVADGLWIAGRIVDNHLRNGARVALLVTGQNHALLVRRNQIQGFQGGIHVVHARGTTIAENEVDTCPLFAIKASSGPGSQDNSRGVSIVGNNVHFSGGSGGASIHLQDAAAGEVRDNLVGQSTGHGIWLDDARGNLIQGNMIRGSVNFGLLIRGSAANGNTYRGNTIRSNGGAGPNPACSASIICGDGVTNNQHNVCDEGTDNLSLLDNMGDDTASGTPPGSC